MRRPLRSTSANSGQGFADAERAVADTGGLQDEACRQTDPADVIFTVGPPCRSPTRVSLWQALVVDIPLYVADTFRIVTL